MNNDEFNFTSSHGTNTPSYFEYFAQRGVQQADVVMPSERNTDLLDFAFYDTYQVIEQPNVTR